MRPLLPLLSLLAMLSLLQPAAGGEASPGPAAIPDYMRYAEDAHSARLEIATRSFRMPSGQQVDLIGVVHLADEAYYQALNRRFDAYDAVLFELIGDPDLVTATPPPLPRRGEGQQSTATVRTLQQLAGRHLNLVFQLDAIDYTKPNMVHADTSAAQYARMQQERGENLMTLLVRALNAQMSGGPHAAAVNNELNLITLLRILTSPDAAAEFKKSLARVFDQGESITTVMEASGGSAVLSGRNEVALDKLREVLADTRQRRVAVFYGSAHMPGMETTLIEEFGARITGEEWLAAWTMPK